MREDNSIKTGIELIVESGVKFSDIHISEGCHLRVRGSDVSIKTNEATPVITRDDIVDFFSASAERKGIDLLDSLSKKDDVNVSLTISINGEEYRFRSSIFCSREKYRAVIRKNDSGIVPFDNLGFGAAGEKIKKLCEATQGIIFVTGATGSGKSTTLASILDVINGRLNGHIITIEDPIEFTHDERECIISQREVGVDVPSFKEAVRGAMRQDPDVIMVGEIRDRETAEAALRASLTGHLVLSTLHTNDATQTIQSFVQIFEAEERSRIQSTLSAALLGIISQALDKDLNNNRILLSELMIATPAIRTTISNGQFQQLHNKISESYGSHGNYLMAHHVKLLLSQKKISPDVARKYFEMSPDSGYKNITL